MTPAEFRAARERLGLTGEAFARAIGTTGRTVRRWESEEGAPPLVEFVISVATRYPGIRRELLERARI